MNLKSELEAGWALRAGQQATALKEAHAKVAALEKSLQQVRVVEALGACNPLLLPPSTQPVLPDC